MDGTTQAIELKKADMIQAASISVPHRGLSLREVGLTRSGAAPVSAAVFAAGIAQVGAAAQEIAESVLDSIGITNHKRRGTP